MRTLYMEKYNVILKGVLEGLQKIQNCIRETLYSNGNEKQCSINTITSSKVTHFYR
jgi:hypothetical protein